MVIDTPLVIIRFDILALEIIQEAGEGVVTVTVNIVENEALPGIFRDMTTYGPIYDFTVTVGDDTVVSDFKGGIVTIEIPYQLVEEEDPHSIVVFYLDVVSGRLQVVRSYYVNLTGTVRFTIGHFSMFMIKHVKTSFTDLPEWLINEGSAVFVGARDFILDVDSTGNIFAPETPLTRAELLSTLMRAYGYADPAFDAGNNFSDVEADSVHAPYIALAKTLGIAKGYGDNTFRPNNLITREEMFTFIYRTLENMSELSNPSADGLDIADFTDAENISYWSKEAITALLSANLIRGINENELVFAPGNESNRAFMTAMIHRLLTR
jgi:hypothetical protein